MRLHRNHYRVLFAVLVITAFFIPAYDKISAFSFFGIAIGSVASDEELTLLDLLVVLIPLLLIPVASLLILFRAIRKKPLNSLLLSIPFFSLAFFFLILSFDMNRQLNMFTMLELLRQMKVGFYIAVSASLLLLFSYSRKESFNLTSQIP